MTSSARRGNNPALTSDDLPQPLGPQIRPTAHVLSGSVSSMRDFQKRIVSGSPSRSRGPGTSSRKKSASWASKERRPFGTILTGWLSEVGGVAVADEPDVPPSPLPLSPQGRGEHCFPLAPGGRGVGVRGEGCTTGVAEGKPLSFFSVP